MSIPNSESWVGFSRCNCGQLGSNTNVCRLEQPLLVWRLQKEAKFRKNEINICLVMFQSFFWVLVILGTLNLLLASIGQQEIVAVHCEVLLYDFSETTGEESCITLLTFIQPTRSIADRLWFSVKTVYSDHIKMLFPFLAKLGPQYSFNCQQPYKYKLWQIPLA